VKRATYPLKTPKTEKIQAQIVLYQNRSVPNPHFSLLAQLQPGDGNVAAIDHDFDIPSIMRVAGLEDGEILEVNQVAAYFAYDNRTVSGLGVSTKGEKLGLSPDDGENWAHS